MKNSNVQNLILLIDLRAAQAALAIHRPMPRGLLANSESKETTTTPTIAKKRPMSNMKKNEKLFIFIFTVLNGSLRMVHPRKQTVAVFALIMDVAALVEIGPNDWA